MPVLHSKQVFIMIHDHVAPHILSYFNAAPMHHGPTVALGQQGKGQLYVSAMSRVLDFWSQSFVITNYYEYMFLPMCPPCCWITCLILEGIESTRRRQV